MAGKFTLTLWLALGGIGYTLTAHWQEVMKTPPAILPASIGGQPQVYVVKQLNDFTSGARANDAGAVMRHVAEKLTAEEITALSAYIADRLH